MSGRDTDCAVQLTLLKEMLDAAAQYADRCGVVDEEELAGLQAAYEVIQNVHVSQAELASKIEALELRVRARLRELKDED